MSKKPLRIKCVHCLCETDEWNWDHVFPASWYPDTTPQNLEKWKIPSCITCNSAYGNMERQMLHRLGLTVNPENLAAMGITDKVHRALNGKFGKNERDSAARDRERDKILSEIIDVTPEIEKGVYPTLNPYEFQSVEEKKAVCFDPDWFNRLSIKIVRGITYLEKKVFIEDPYEISFYAIEEEDNNPILRAVSTYGYTHYRGPGLTIRMGRVGEDPLTSIFVIDIWQHIRMYAVCINKKYKNGRLGIK